jgi:hypothetical protein
MASILASVDPAAKVIGIDSFKGINNAIDALDTHQVGDFSGVAAEEVRHFSSDKHLTNILVTQAELGGGVHQIAASGSLGLVHIDCDTFMSTKAALGASWEAVCEMGYLIVDDVVEPSCLGATLAALDFMFEKEIRPNQMWPHLVIRKNSKRKRD